MDLQALWDFDRPAESERRFREALASAASSVSFEAPAEPSSEATAEAPSAESSPVSTEDALVLRTQLARALGLQNRFDEAGTELDGVAGAGSDSPLVVTYLKLERGRVLRSSGDAEAARPQFLQALDIACAAGIDHLAADAAHMLAITCEGEEQIPWARRALEIAEASPDPRARRWVASVTHNLGWTVHDIGRHDEALGLWERALAARLEQDGDPEAVRIARWTVARGLRSLGRHEEALTIQRSLADAGPEDGYVHQELAELLGALGRPGEAARHAERARALLAD